MSYYLTKLRTLFSRTAPQVAKEIAKPPLPVLPAERKGLAAFFPPGVYEGENYAEDDPQTGRPWRERDLRLKSNVDLHKFWYVLLKERNMLLTLEHECKRQGVPMPGPTRIHKVESAMKSLETVLNERKKAILFLETRKRYKFDEENPLYPIYDSTNNNRDTTDAHFKDSEHTAKTHENTEYGEKYEDTEKKKQSAEM